MCVTSIDLDLSFVEYSQFFSQISATIVNNGRLQNTNRDYQLLADFSSTARLPRPCIISLENLSVQSNAADIIAALILYIFHECGFVSFDSPDATTTIPTYWGYTNVTQIPEYYSTEAIEHLVQQQKQRQSVAGGDRSYTIYLKLLNFSEERLVLIMREIANGDALCISFCFRDRSESICLPVTEFIQFDGSASVLQQVQRSPTECLKNIELLVNKVKSQLITPIRNAVMLAAGLRCPSLIGLPKEILWHLMKRLDLRSLQNLSHACNHMRNEARIYLNENHINVASNRRSTPIIRMPSNYSYPRLNLFRFN